MLVSNETFCLSTPRYWRCIKRAGCTGKLQTTLLGDRGQVPATLGLPSAHNHGPHTAQTLRGRAISEMRKSVKDTPLQQLKSTYDAIVNNQQATCVDPALLPTYQSVETILKRQRADDRPKLPKQRTDIDLQGEWAAGPCSERFALPTPNSEILIFVTDANLLRLSRCKTIYMDGTFKTCPSLYTQLFTIHGLCNNFVVPLVYILLADKCCATYYQVFNLLRDAVSSVGGVFDPDIILSDFESGLIEAVRRQFPRALHSGCHFHFTQAVWRKVQDLGLVTFYTDPTKTDIAEFIQLCMALAFVPEVDIIRQFSNCINNLTQENSDVLKQFIAYFRDTWVSGLFPTSMWNKYGQNYLHRTNNRVESWHATLKHKLPIHPNIYVLIRALKSVESGTQLTLAKVDAGDSPPQRRAKYVKLEATLQKAYEMHRSGEMDTAALLRRVRHCVHKAV